MYVHTYSKNTFPKVPNYTSTFKIQEGDISIPIVNYIKLIWQMKKLHT